MRHLVRVVLLQEKKPLLSPLKSKLESLTRLLTAEVRDLMRRRRGPMQQDVRLKACDLQVGICAKERDGVPMSLPRNLQPVSAERGIRSQRVTVSRSRRRPPTAGLAHVGGLLRERMNSSRRPGWVRPGSSTMKRGSAEGPTRVRNEAKVSAPSGAHKERLHGTARSTKLMHVG